MVVVRMGRPTPHGGTIDTTLLARLPELAVAYRAGTLAAAEYATYYILYWQYARFGDRLALRRARNDPKPSFAWLVPASSDIPTVRADYLIDFLQRHDLREVRRRVCAALIGWLTQQWPVTLLERIPSTMEVVALQARGSRPVTLITDYPRLLQPVLDKADGFAFAVHDLEHAWQFFRDPASRAAQTDFAARLHAAILAGAFAPYAADSVFMRKFEYLAADMNTHTEHSVQYLRAILIEHHLRIEGKPASAELTPTSRARIEQCLAAVRVSET
jgi:hypothetical protein